MNKTISKLIFLSIGLAAGAAIGILYAPEEGSSTRDKLSFQLSKYRERLKEMLNKIKEIESSPIGNEGKAKSEMIIDETKQEAEKLLGHVEDLMNQIRNQKGA